MPLPSLAPTLLQVMREFGFLVRVCTPREATNFGIFFNEVLGLVERWKVSQGSPEVLGWARSADGECRREQLKNRCRWRC